MPYFFGRDKACETSAITTVNLKTNDQKFGSHIGNMSNPLYLEIDSWVCTPTVSTFFDKIVHVHIHGILFLRLTINDHRILPMTSFLTLFTCGTRITLCNR